MLLYVNGVRDGIMMRITLFGTERQLDGLGSLYGTGGIFKEMKESETELLIEIEGHCLRGSFCNYLQNGNSCYFVVSLALQESNGIRKSKMGSQTLEFIIYKISNEWCRAVLRWTLFYKIALPCGMLTRLAQF